MVLDPNPEVRYVAVLFAVDQQWYVELGIHPQRDLAQVVVHGPFLSRRDATTYARLHVDARARSWRRPRTLVSKPQDAIPVPDTIKAPDWPARDV